MSGQSVELLESQAFGLMGRLHVLLRREIGRVTDIKYMSIDAEYCRHVLELAAAVNNPDLQAMSQKLAAIYFGEGGLFADASAKARRLAPSSFTRTPEPAEKPKAELELSAESDQHYVGRLR